MIMRKDVLRLAERFAKETKLDVDHIYYFLMQTGKSLGINPKRLNFTTGEGIIFLTGKRDSYCLEDFKRLTQINRWSCNDAESLYWEGRILARGEIDD